MTSSSPKAVGRASAILYFLSALWTVVWFGLGALGLFGDALTALPSPLFLVFVIGGQGCLFAWGTYVKARFIELTVSDTPGVANPVQGEMGGLSLGLVARQKSPRERLSDKMAVIFVALLVVLCCVGGIGLRQIPRYILVPLASTLVAILTLLGVSSFFLLRGDTARKGGDWVVDGFIWNRESNVWVSGTLRVQINPAGERESAVWVQATSPRYARPPQPLQSKHLELRVTFSSPWDQGYGIQFGMYDDRGRALSQPAGDLYLLTGSHLQRLCGTPTVLPRRLGESLVSHSELNPPPLSVVLNVCSPEGNPNSLRYGQRMAFGALLIALGQSLEQSKDRKAQVKLMKKMLYGDAHAYKSDNLKAIADTFGWTLLVDGRP